MEEVIQKEKAGKKFKTRDIMTIAAMMVLTLIVYSLAGTLTLPFPIAYLYFCAGIQALLCATFYLVIAHRLNKHGILFIWSAVFGVMSALGGYLFLLPYFLLVGIICELSMLGKNTYRNPIRNAIGWAIYCLGMILGNIIPIIVSWESYISQAAADGFTQEVLDMQLAMLTTPTNLLIACAITVVMALLGCVLGQKILKKHFQKAGLVQ